ncbi:predicted protein [Plenodomus lingam JN3]|uniref:Uncharacterized protein n=1 Tax=Leptosphaeria maculans (strain JN3 / isolate v23.1.3 / race Av1-4-5-6-7-8) TaxID=985895 RepID=E4ZGL6_LEPMJ|nr:predicted protein [Plenodomus lingam JN3]CBX90436.1 predicted protein [Plenodomus lingam JN3]
MFVLDPRTLFTIPYVAQHLWSLRPSSSRYFLFHSSYLTTSEISSSNCSKIW